jgi:DNA-binding Xre family transcriptional regulator
MIKNRLKILLAERDLNYSKLSKMTGISVNALSKMGKKGGTGSTQITYQVLEKLCKALKSQVGDLLVWEEKKKK